jgi:hypothetical protein
LSGEKVRGLAWGSNWFLEKVQIPTPTSNLMVGEALELIIVNCKLSSSRFMELP